MCLEMDGNGTTFGRYTQVDELFCLAAELWEKEGRLRSISESEKEIDQWRHGLTFLIHTSTFNIGTSSICFVSG